MSADPFTRASWHYGNAMRRRSRNVIAFWVGRKRNHHPIRDMAAYLGFALFLIWLIQERSS